MKLLICAAFFCFFTTSCAHQPQFKRDPASVARAKSSVRELEAEEKVFLDLINEARALRKLPLVQIADDLLRSADCHSEYMDRNLSFAHEQGSEPKSEFYNHQSRIRFEGGKYRKTGETIFRGSPSGKDAFEMWSASLQHQKIMLDPEFQFIGISVKGKYSLGREFPYYWTADFGGY